MTSGQTLVATTTLATLIDTVFTNKTAALTGAAATYTAIDPVTLQASWPSLGGGNDLVFIRFESRPVSPEIITL